MPCRVYGSRKASYKPKLKVQGLRSRTTVSTCGSYCFAGFWAMHVIKLLTESFDPVFETTDPIWTPSNSSRQSSRLVEVMTLNPKTPKTSDCKPSALNVKALKTPQPEPPM